MIDANSPVNRPAGSPTNHSANQTKKKPEHGSQRTRWVERVQLPFAFLAAPLAWALQLIFGYFLVPSACSLSRVPLALLGLVAVLVGLAGTMIGIRQWTQIERPSMGSLEAARENRQFIPVFCVLVSSLFLLLIVVTAVTNLFIYPCPFITMPLP